MDRERLGRVLGRGTRLAARTALEAVDAATSAPPKAPIILSPRPTDDPVTRLRSDRAGVVLPRNIGPAVAAARKGVLAPLRQASRALWHELTGSFFALFAVSFGLGVWHTRANAFSSLAVDRYRLYAFCALTLLFAWFSISSFVRAHRRSTPNASS